MRQASAYDAALEILKIDMVRNVIHQGAQQIALPRQSFLRLFALGNVGNHAIRVEFPMFLVRGHRPVMHPNPLAVFSLNPEFLVKHRMAFQERLIGSCNLFTIVRMNSRREKARSAGFLRGETVYLFRIGTDKNRIAFCVARPRNVGNIRDQSPVLLFASPKFGMRQLAFRYVESGTDKTYGPPLGISDNLAATANYAHRPVLPDGSMLTIERFVSSGSILKSFV